MVVSASIDISTNQAIVHFGGVGTISAQANGGSGLVRHTDAGHTLKVGEIVEISGTTSYNGVFPVINVAKDTFDLEQTWVVNDASGLWKRGFEPFSTWGYLYTRIAYAGSAVTVDKQSFAIDKSDDHILRIESTGWLWKIDDGVTTFYLQNISCPSTT